MGRGVTWTSDENRILKYMYEQKKTDEEIHLVLSNRDVQAIKIHRKQRGLVSKPVLPKAIVKTISPPKHSDNLPDVGEQLAKIISLLTDVCLNQMDLYDLFKRLDNAKHTGTDDQKSRSSSIQI